MATYLVAVVRVVSLVALGSLALFALVWWLLHMLVQSVFKRMHAMPQACTLRQLVKAAEGRAMWTEVHQGGYLVAVGSLVRHQLDQESLLGVGTYSAVYGVHLLDVPFSVCFKELSRKYGSLGELLRECNNLERLKEVEGLPRVLAVSIDPLGFFMTQHGGRGATMASWGKGLSQPSEALVVGAIYRLCTILNNVHCLQLCHNDIKLNNVAVEVGPRGRVEVTLLDLGLMRSYGCFPWGFKRIRKDSSKPLKPFYDPELIKGEKPCSEKTEVYAVGYLMQRLLPLLSVTRKQMTIISQMAMTSAADHRPALKDLVTYTHYALLTLLPDVLLVSSSVSYPSVLLEDSPSSLRGRLSEEVYNDLLNDLVDRQAVLSSRRSRLLSPSSASPTTDQSR